jgi:hypothetical protein
MGFSSRNMTPPFTDEDLKRLKGSTVWQANVHWMPALIARLEAAERALDDNCRDENTECQLCPVHHKEYMAWRKAAGKISCRHCWTKFKNHGNDEHCCWCQIGRQAAGK